MEEICISILVGLSTGIISGLISGWIVTKYYRKKDEKIAEFNERSKYVNIFLDYLEDLGAEITILGEGVSPDTTEVKRLLQKKHKYLQILYSAMILPQQQEIFEYVYMNMDKLRNILYQKAFDCKEAEYIISLISLKLIVLFSRPGEKEK